MNQKEYLKLVVDTTTLFTKAKLLQDQLTVITAAGKEHIGTANEKLKSVEASLAKINTAPITQDPNETAITGATIKRLLHTIEKELKNNIEYVTAQQNKQLTALSEGLQKLITQKEALGVDLEFDLTTVEEQTTKTQEILTSCDQALQGLLHQLDDTQQTIHKFEEANSALMIDQELQEATQKTALLSRKISNIEHCIENLPELKAKHAGQLVPLVRAFESLTTKTKLLDLAKDLPAIDEKVASPAKSVKDGRHTSPTRIKASATPIFK